MAVLVWVFCAVNLWFGVRWLGASLGLTRYRRYALGTTASFALLALASAAVGIVCVTGGGDVGLGLAATAGPWALALLVMFVALVTGRQQ